MDNAFMSSLYLRNAVGRVDFEKTEQWDALLDLTYAVWRVADITVESDMLKDRLKRGAMDILSDYPSAVAGRMNSAEVMDKIRAQCALLSLAQKTAHGSRQMNFVILKNEYYKISAMLAQQTEDVVRAPRTEKHPAHPQYEEVRSEQAFERSAQVAHSEKPASAHRHDVESVVRASVPAPVIKKSAPVSALNDRQKKILQFFNKRKEDNIRLKEIAQFFPDLTDRTVRNDLRDLCMKKMISRSEGHGQASFYRLAKNGIDADGEGVENKE